MWYTLKVTRDNLPQEFIRYNFIRLVYRDIYALPRCFAPVEQRSKDMEFFQCQCLMKNHSISFAA